MSWVGVEDVARWRRCGRRCCVLAMGGGWTRERTKSGGGAVWGCVFAAVGRNRRRGVES